MATNKNKTPLLRPLRDFGGTLYIFPSANEDIGLNINSRATGVALSHYALLNLPPNNNANNKFQPTTGTTGMSTKGFNSAIATDLQNYVMNFETVLINQEGYNYSEYQTVSERVFWHWLIDKISTVSLTATQIPGTYKEKSGNYDRVVQCFGSIDAGNSLSTEFGIFNETYINIPSSYGAGPVFFKKIEDTHDTNLKTGKEYKQTSQDYYLEGRTLDNANTLRILDSVNPIYDGGSYYKVNTAYELVKDIPTIQAILEKEVSPDIIVSSFDDINIDPNEMYEGTQYDITSTIDKSQFEFNAILLYYSVYDQDDKTREPLAINLFGIIFLDGATKSGSSDFIAPMVKKKSYMKPSDTGNQTNYFGNSYSFRVNIKTMSIYDNTDAMIQDNTTLSSIKSVEFSDVISNLNRAINIMNTNVQTTQAIQDSYLNILTYYNDQRENIDDLSTLINAYVRGTHAGIIDTDILYANQVHPNPDNSSNDIKISLIDGSVDNVVNYSLPIQITKNNAVAQPGIYYPVESSVNFVVYQDMIEKESLSALLNNISVNSYQIDDENHTIIPEIDYNSIPNELQHVVKYDNGQYYMDYAKLVPYLLSEIQYLKNKINELSQ